MKKICVITRHAIVNYGSFLQTFATQKLFEELGYEVTILDYVRPDENYHNVTDLLLKKSKKWNKNFFTRTLYTGIQWPDHYISGKFFETLRNKSLNLSDRIEKPLLQYSKIPKADYYCTGSDQVWGEIAQDDLDPAYFWNFLPNNSNKIAFSASFGKHVYDTNRINKFKSLLQDYKTISVRENSAVDIVRKSGKESFQILDPTMIYGGDNWKRIIPKNSERHYVLLYQLNTSKEMDEYAKRFAKKVGLPLIRVSVEAHNFMKNGRFRWCLSPFKFLSYVANADYMITDSFHGTAFAIMFNKQFLEVLPKEKQARNRSVLEQFGLEDRIVNDLNDYSLSERKIDYIKVNQKLDTLREESYKIMKNLFIED